MWDIMRPEASQRLTAVAMRERKKRGGGHRHCALPFPVLFRLHTMSLHIEEDCTICHRGIDLAVVSWQEIGLALENVHCALGSIIIHQHIYRARESRSRMSCHKFSGVSGRRKRWLHFIAVTKQMCTVMQWRWRIKQKSSRQDTSCLSSSSPSFGFVD